MSGDALESGPAISAFAFGKLPAHGDFIGRGLNDETIQSADEVIASALAIGMTQWDTGWDDVYVETPVWRFMATPGVLGPFWTAGVFMASIDAVGRQYPLVGGVNCSTLALLAEPEDTARMLEAAEAAVRDALVGALTVDVLIERLTALPVAAGRQGPEASFSRQMLNNIESKPCAAGAVWWVAGGGDEFCLRHEGGLTAEFVSGLFRRASPDAIIVAEPQDGMERSAGAGAASDGERDNDPAPVVSSPDTGGATDVPRPT